MEPVASGSTALIRQKEQLLGNEPGGLAGYALKMAAAHSGGWRDQFCNAAVVVIGVPALSSVRLVVPEE